METELVRPYPNHTPQRYEYRHHVRDDKLQVHVSWYLPKHWNKWEGGETHHRLRTNLPPLLDVPKPEGGRCGRYSLCETEVSVL